MIDFDGKRFCTALALLGVVSFAACGGGGGDDGSGPFARFAGTYAGTFSGDDSGNFSAQVSSHGQITGSGTSVSFGGFPINGQVTQGGNVTFALGSTDESNFSGRVDDSGTIQGTWNNRVTGESGTFIGSRAEGPLVSGVWSLSVGGLATSTCGAELDAAIVQILGFQAPCNYDVSQAGASITANQCNGAVYQGSVDRDGNVTMSTSAMESEAGCTIAANIQIRSQLTANFTPADISLDLNIAGNCEGLRDCRVELSGNFTRSSGSLAVTSNSSEQNTSSIGKLLDHVL